MILICATKYAIKKSITAVAFFAFFLSGGTGDPADNRADNRAGQSATHTGTRQCATGGDNNRGSFILPVLPASNSPTFNSFASHTHILLFFALITKHFLRLCGMHLRKSHTPFFTSLRVPRFVNFHRFGRSHIDFNYLRRVRSRFPNARFHLFHRTKGSFHRSSGTFCYLALFRRFVRHFRRCRRPFYGSGEMRRKSTRPASIVSARPMSRQYFGSRGRPSDLCPCRCVPRICLLSAEIVNSKI